MTNFKAGFTLLEVLIALMILSIVMGGFVYQLQRHSQLTWTVNQKISAGRWLNNKLNEVTLSPEKPALGEVEQIVAVHNYHWLFKYHAELTKDDQLVHVTLSLEEIDGVRVYEIEGLVIYEH